MIDKVNLYLLTQNQNKDRDAYAGCIVCANSESYAKDMLPSCDLWGANWKWTFSQKWSESSLWWASSREYVSCKLIGTAPTGAKVGAIVCWLNGQTSLMTRI